MKSKAEFLRTLMIIFFLAIIAFSGYKIITIVSDYNRVTEINREARDEYISSYEDGLPVVDFDKLLGMNRDICGWIYIPDTNINFPVVRGEDNDMYLHSDYTGRYSFAGSIFMDYRCSADFSDSEILLHGHNMHNGDMFGRLKRFEDGDYLKSHEDVYVSLPTGAVMRYKAAEGHYVDINDGVYSLPKEGEPEELILSTCTDDSSETVRFILRCSYEGEL